MLTLLKVLILSLWAAYGPGWQHSGNAGEIAVAIASAVLADGDRAPVFSSHVEDAAVMAYYALKESSLRDGVTDGTSYGVWQQPLPVGTADVATQARAWLATLHLGAKVCPISPSAPQTGGCVRARKLADRRVAAARALLQTVLTRDPLPQTHPLEQLVSPSIVAFDEKNDRSTCTNGHDGS